MKALTRLRSRRDQRGATAVEYAMLASFVAAVIVATVATLGMAVSDLFTTVPNPW